MAPYSRQPTCLCILLLALFCASQCVASSLVHKVPRSGQRSKTIHGHTLSDPVDGFGDRYVVDFQATLVHDTLFWNEMVSSGISMDTCAKIGTKLGTKMTLTAPGLTKSDLSGKPILTMSKEEYEDVCGHDIPTGIDDIPDEDPALFFKIKRVKQDGDKLKLRLKMVSRRLAVPSISATVHNTLVSNDFLQAPIVVDDASRQQYLTAARMLRMVRSGAPLPAGANATMLPSTSTRFSLTKNVNKDMGGGSMGVALSAGGKFSSWKISAGIKCSGKWWKPKCSLRADASWEQSFDASAEAALTFSAGFSKDTSGAIAQWPVGGGFSVNVPALGKVGVSLFVKLDWVADISVETYTTASAKVWYEKKEKITVDIIGGKLEARSLSSSGGGDAGFDLGAEAGAEVVGFVGVRPAFGAEAGFGKELDTEINIGAKIGVEASLKARTPAYSPYTGNKLKIGICSKCHWVQGSIGVKGKDLAVVAEVGKSDKDWTLVDDLFYFEVGRLCAVEADSC